MMMKKCSASIGASHAAKGQRIVKPTEKLALAVLFAANLALPAFAQTPASITTPDKFQTRLGPLEFKDGAPSKETVEKVYNNLGFMHASETFLNAFRGASLVAARKGFISAGAEDNSIMIFTKMMDSKSLFLTANADTPYFISFIDLSKGPMVAETPPLSLGAFDDMWFRWVIDFGLPGPDPGEGGKYLLVPPGYTGDLPDSGFHVARSRTTRVLLMGRSFLDNNDPKPAVELIKKTLKIYPYQPGGFGTSIATGLDGKVPLLRSPDGKLDWAFLRPQPPAKFVEVSGKSFNTIPPNDYSYFETINELVQQEPADAQNSHGRSCHGGRDCTGARVQSARIRGLLLLPRLGVAELAVGWWLRVRDAAAASEFRRRQQTLPTDRRAHSQLAHGVVLLRDRYHAGHDHALAWHRLAIRVGVHRCGQELLGWLEDLQGHVAAEHPGREVLVAHTLRQSEPFDAPDAATLPPRRQPKLSDSGRVGEPRWLHDRVFQPDQTRWRERRQLDSDGAGQGLQRHAPPIQPARNVFHKAVAAKRGRTGEVSGGGTRRGP